MKSLVPRQPLRQRAPLRYVIVGLVAPWLSYSSWAAAQAEKNAGSTTDANASVQAPTPNDPAPPSAPSQLLVHIQLNNSTLTPEKIKDALREEFHMPVVLSSEARGLELSIQGRSLSASFAGDDGAVVRRDMELPEDEHQQLLTIALLSGSIARDETGALLARLHAPHTEADPTDGIPEPPPLPDDSEAESVPAPATAPTGNPTPPPPNPATPPKAAATAAASSQTSPPPSTTGKQLPDVFLSASIAGRLTFPRDLPHKSTHFHVGVITSDIGHLRGVAASLVAHKIRGADPRGAGYGLQAALAVVRSSGNFRGVTLSALVANTEGLHQGFVGAGIFQLHRGDVHGAQLGGLVAMDLGTVRGVQLGGLGTIQIGPVHGVQVAGLTAFAGGDVRGVQASLLTSVSTGRVDGSQLSGFLSYAHRGLSGYQMALINIARRRMDAVQVGLINVAGNFRGTQVGIINVGGVGRGTQVGLINIAKQIKGAAIAPLNIITGARNQLLTYASYIPYQGLEGTPVGPLSHMAFKSLPGPFYTQIGFGLGAEAKECATDEMDVETCHGGGTVYAPSFAVGGRANFGKTFYVELDVQYQFVRGFNESRSSLHQALGRVAAGVQLTRAVALFAGGGPGVDFYEGPRVSPSPDVKLIGHGFAGLAFF